MNKVVINIDTDKKCSICGKKGTTQNGRCLTCIGEYIEKLIKEQREKVKSVSEKKES